MDIQFVKLLGNWYINLPKHFTELCVEECEMVLGMDTVCEILSKGNSLLSVSLATTPKEGTYYSCHLVKSKECCSLGKVYVSTIYKNPNTTYSSTVILNYIWNEVFKEYPEDIYIYVR